MLRHYFRVPARCGDGRSFGSRCGWLILGSLIGWVAALAVAVPGADAADWFPFPIPSPTRDALPLDLSGLNTRPAGRDGFLRAADGHLVDGRGSRVRLFGINLTGDANLPEKTGAARLASRLARFGFNAVRLHMMDVTFSLTPTDRRFLIQYPRTGGLDPVQLDRLDYFVAKLKEQGIYVTLTLHVARVYPALLASGSYDGPFQFSQPLDLFYPPFVTQFKDYARTLLRHVNPYTGLRYAEEPAVAAVEINNENSLLTLLDKTPLLPANQPSLLAAMPEPYRAELRRQWVAWLTARYGTTTALQQAWGLGNGSPVPGANLVAALTPGVVGDTSRDSDCWSIAAPIAMRWCREVRPTDDPGASASIEAIPGIAGIRWRISQAGRLTYSHQIKFRGLTLSERGAYRLTLSARAPGAATALATRVMLDESPWTDAGLNREETLGADWRTLTYDFIAGDTRANGVRLNLMARNQPAVIDVRAVSLQPLATGVLLPTQTLQAGNIPFTAGAPNWTAYWTARRDFLSFLMDTERRHAQAMRAYTSYRHKLTFLKRLEL